MPRDRYVVRVERPSPWLAGYRPGGPPLTLIEKLQLAVEAGDVDRVQDLAEGVRVAKAMCGMEPDPNFRAAYLEACKKMGIEADILSKKRLDAKRAVR